MTDMVEKVARALCAQQWPEFTQVQIDHGWTKFIPAARAAIQAMREPSEAMISAGGYNRPFQNDDWKAGNIAAASGYRAMIDAALTPPQASNSEDKPGV